MKSAVLIGADWPADEVVLVLDQGEESTVLFKHLAIAETAMVGGRLVAVMDRTAFRVLRRYAQTAEKCARVGMRLVPRLDAPDTLPLRTLLAHLNTLARALADAVADDRAGDPPPGAPLHPELAEELAEAGR